MMTDTQSIQKYNIMIVAPGSNYSTFDTYTYYLDAFKRSEFIENAYGFAFESVVTYHMLAREGLFSGYGIIDGDESADIARAARELLLEVYLRRPQAIFIIDGSKFPVQIFVELKRMQVELHRRMVLSGYITEAPYINDVVDQYAKFYDVIFTNDKGDAIRRDPNEEKAIYYLPHSFNPAIHYPYPVHEKYHKDVFFCGTIFPERAQILSGVNWSGIDALLSGSWQLADLDLLDKIKSYGIVSEETMKNDEVAEYYRGAKIAINLFRVFGWTPEYDQIEIDANAAYSVGPRIIEAAACGAFIISEPRPELTELFGDSIPTFRDASELESLIRYYLEHEDERKEKALRSMAAVQGMTYDHRVEFVNKIMIQAIKAVNPGG